MVSTPRKGRGPILSEKVAIVTGGASGIGRETALLFAEEGAAVTIVDLDARGGEETAQEMKEEGFQSLGGHTGRPAVVLLVAPGCGGQDLWLPRE